MNNVLTLIIKTTTPTLRHRSSKLPQYHTLQLIGNRYD
ncbi:hypothetical protein PE36_00714 [Moritella sp. PE36]|nr:hypothetical protein PE36_00714 [Moritella sp. PE36]